MDVDAVPVRRMLSEMTLPLAAALGFGLGVVTGLPLGVINVAIVDAALAGRRRFAAGVGVGGALADTVHSMLAFLGYAHLVTGNAVVPRLLAVTSTLVILGYAVFVWRRRRHAGTATVRGHAGLFRGLGTGVALTLPNPAPLAAWVVIAAALLPAASTTEAMAAALGIGLGSATWFVLLGRIVTRVPQHHAALRVLPRVAVIALVAIALIGVARVVGL